MAMGRGILVPGLRLGINTADVSTLLPGAVPADIWLANCVMNCSNFGLWRAIFSSGAVHPLAPS